MKKNLLTVFFGSLIFASGYCYAQQTKEQPSNGPAPIASTAGISEREIKRTLNTSPKIQAAFVRKKYGGGENMEQAFLKIYEEREFQLNRARERYNGKPELEKQLLIILEKADSAETVMLRPALGNKYISSKIRQLNQVKQMSKSEENDLKNIFLNKLKDGAENYEETFSLVSGDVLSDTIYFAKLYAKEIAQRAGVAAQTYLAALQLKSNDAKKKAALVIYNRERELATFAFLNIKNTKDRTALLAGVFKKYDKKIDSLQLQSGEDLPNTPFSTAIRFSKLLGLQKSQVDSLIAYNVQIRQLRNEFYKKSPTGGFNHQEFESKKLTSLLNDGQFTQLMTMIYTDQAEAYSITKWQAMEKSGVSAGLDGPVVKRQIKDYYLNRLITKAKYAFDLNLQTEQVRTLDSVKPQILRKLDTALKNPEKVETVGAKLAW